MKRLIPTALVLALLTGTSAFAQGGDRDDQRGRGRGREAPPAAQPAPQQSAPQAAPPQRQPPQAQPQGQQSASQEAPRTRITGGFRAAQLQAQAQAQARAQAQAQAQAEAQARAQAQAQAQRGGQGSDRPQNGRGDPNGRNGRDGRGGRDTTPPSSGRGAPGWDRGGPNGQRPPVVRPQDRRDRDYGRRPYDPGRWQFQVRPQRQFYWRGPTYYLPYNFYAGRWAYGQVLPWNWYTPDYYIDDWAFYGLPFPPVGCEWVRLGHDAVLVDVFSGRILSVEYNLFF